MLKRLKESDVNKLKGDVIVPNLVSAVMEMVMNSLDAESTSIDIRIDLMRWYLQVFVFVFVVKDSNLKVISNLSRSPFNIALFEGE